MKCVLALVSVASAFVAQPRVLPARTVRAAEAPTMVTGKQVAAGLAAGIIFGGAAASQAIEVRLAAPSEALEVDAVPLIPRQHLLMPLGIEPIPRTRE